MEARDFASPQPPVVGTPFWHAVLIATRILIKFCSRRRQRRLGRAAGVLGVGAVRLPRQDLGEAGRCRSCATRSR